MTETPRPKRKGGFATMDPVLRSKIASMGGKAAHEAGTAHEWTKDEARDAGAKGGRTPKKTRRVRA